MTAGRQREQSQDIRIWDDAEEHAYLVDAGGLRAGKAVYHLRGGRHFFVHTEIGPDFEGTGLGQKLVAFALDDVRSKGGSVVPICPFFAAYIRRHPEYDDLVDHEIMARIERAQEQD